MLLGLDVEDILNKDCSSSFPGQFPSAIVRKCQNRSREICAILFLGIAPTQGYIQYWIIPQNSKKYQATTLHCYWIMDVGMWEIRKVESERIQFESRENFPQAKRMGRGCIETCGMRLFSYSISRNFSLTTCPVLSSFCVSVFVCFFFYSIVIMSSCLHFPCNCYWTQILLICTIHNVHSPALPCGTGTRMFLKMWQHWLIYLFIYTY